MNQYFELIQDFLMVSLGYTADEAKVAIYGVAATAIILPVLFWLAPRLVPILLSPWLKRDIDKTKNRVKVWIAFAQRNRLKLNKKVLEKLQLDLVRSLDTIDEDISISEFYSDMKKHRKRPQFEDLAVNYLNNPETEDFEALSHPFSLWGEYQGFLFALGEKTLYKQGSSSTNTLLLIKVVNAPQELSLSRKELKHKFGSSKMESINPDFDKHFLIRSQQETEVKEFLTTRRCSQLLEFDRQLKKKYIDFELNDQIVKMSFYGTMETESDLTQAFNYVKELKSIF